MTNNWTHSPFAVFTSLWWHRHLIWQLTRREVIGRYRGSFMGLLWSFFNPLIMLGIYTFVFGVVFQARWANRATGTVEFALILFAGLIVFTLFSDCVNRAPGLILSNANFVKRVVFPLESLAWVVLGSTLFHTLVSVVVLILACVAVYHTVQWTIVFLPLVLFPFLLLTIGVSWFLAALGVFLRDVGQAVGLFTTALLFLSPVFYPTTALPEGMRPYLFLNPLAFIIEETRDTVIWGALPNWRGLLVGLAVGWGVAWLGLLWFEHSRSGFADVL
jgi:lipopolysaccharide transport system permease protein